jgi:DNA transformation protein and related proteins
MSGLVEHLLDVLSPLGRVTAPRFFGGNALKLGRVQFGFVFDDVVYLRVDPALARELESLGSEPFRYQTKKREVRVGKYWSVPDGQLDDEDAFVEWARRALRTASRPIRK